MTWVRAVLLSTAIYLARSHSTTDPVQTLDTTGDLGEAVRNTPTAAPTFAAETAAPTFAPADAEPIIKQDALINSGTTHLGATADFTGAEYFSLKPILIDKLRAKSVAGLADYRGPSDNAIFEHLWHRNTGYAECGMEANIDVKICWDSQPTKSYETNAGNFGTIGTNARHSDNCSQLIQHQFNTRLNYNISAATMTQILRHNLQHNLQPDPNQIDQTNVTADAHIVHCKKWYVDIVSSLEAFLTEFKRVQMGCLVDLSLIDRTKACWDVVSLANAGKTPGMEAFQLSSDLGESMNGDTDINEDAQDLLDAAEAELGEGESEDESEDELDFS